MKRVLSLLFLACIVFSCVSAEEQSVEESVVVLTSENFEQVIKDNPFVLVKFYVSSIIFNVSKIFNKLLGPMVWIL